MLYCPFRLPRRASRWLPGGERRNSRVFAESSWVSLRTATSLNARKRGGEPPSNSACVCLHRKDRIMTNDITRGVIRQAELRGRMKRTSQGVRVDRHVGVDVVQVGRRGGVYYRN